MNYYIKYLLTVIVILIVSFQRILAQDQQEDVSRRKINFFLVGGIARSIFEVDIPASKFATPEFRLGVGASKYIGRFEFKPSVLMGLKGTRPSYKIGQVYTQPGVPLLKLNDASSNRNHFVVDVPILFQYDLTNPDIGFRLGFNSRFWAPNNQSIDILTAKQEIGLLAGSCVNLKNFSVGLDFYYGLTKIHGGSITYNGEFYTFEVINIYSQITIEVPF
ncbi:MAG: hypothetical protein DYG99_16540 [Bacteroidetes bacterium CHB5]|nr:hypothetical protein [Bacteroidetes bacterium CHB5]